MLDVKNPEINVDDLMERIREEARRRREWNARREQNSMEADWAHGVEEAGSPVDSETIDQALTIAQQFSAVGLNLPPMTRLQGLKRKLAIPIVRLILRLAQLVTRDQRAFNAASLDMFRAMHEGLKALAARLEEVAAQAQRFAVARIATLREEHAARLTALGEEHAALREEHVALREEHAAQLAALREEHTGQLAALREEHTARLAEVADLLQAEQARIDRLRTALLLQERRLSLLLEEARRRLPEP
ncbi:MAG: hypothetical protein HYV08_03725, partial [Deltaproteobacteria bacterium]|nr:hypothetical protein [Deltaproteobacteria bacterium]